MPDVIIPEVDDIMAESREVMTPIVLVGGRGPGIDLAASQESSTVSNKQGRKFFSEDATSESEDGGDGSPKSVYHEPPGVVLTETPSQEDNEDDFEDEIAQAQRDDQEKIPKLKGSGSLSVSMGGRATPSLDVPSLQESSCSRDLRAETPPTPPIPTPTSPQLHFTHRVARADPGSPNSNTTGTTSIVMMRGRATPTFGPQFGLNNGSELSSNTGMPALDSDNPAGIISVAAKRWQQDHIAEDVTRPPSSEEDDMPSRMARSSLSSPGKMSLRERLRLRLMEHHMAETKLVVKHVYPRPSSDKDEAEERNDVCEAASGDDAADEILGPFRPARSSKSLSSIGDDLSDVGAHDYAAVEDSFSTTPNMRSPTAKSFVRSSSDAVKRTDSGKRLPSDSAPRENNEHCEESRKSIQIILKDLETPSSSPVLNDISPRNSPSPEKEDGAAKSHDDEDDGDIVVVVEPSSSQVSSPKTQTSASRSKRRPHQPGLDHAALVRLSRTARFGRRGEMPLKRSANRIRLHVYDLLTQDTIMALPWGCHFPIGRCFQTMNNGLHALGTGAYHCGIEINGIEYAYGANEIEGSTGVFTCVPKRSPGYEYRSSLDFGDRPLMKKAWVHVPQTGSGGSDTDSAGGVYKAIEVFIDGRDIIKEMAMEYLGMDYDLLRKNCCTFAKDACLRLGISENEIPKWFMNLADAGAATQDAMRPLSMTVPKGASKEIHPTPPPERGFEVIPTTNSSDSMRTPGGTVRKGSVKVVETSEASPEDDASQDERVVGGVRRTASWTY